LTRLLGVPQHSAKTTCDDYTWAIDSDHYQIVKPANHDSDIHVWVRRKIASTLSGLETLDADSAITEILRLELRKLHVDDLPSWLENAITSSAKKRLGCRTRAVASSMIKAAISKLVAKSTTEISRAIAAAYRQQFDPAQLRTILAQSRSSEAIERIIRSLSKKRPEWLDDYESVAAKDLSPDAQERYRTVEKIWRLSRVEVALPAYLYSIEKTFYVEELRNQLARLKSMVPTLRDIFISVYLQHATHDELLREVEFLSSPLGHKSLNVSLDTGLDVLPEITRAYVGIYDLAKQRGMVTCGRTH
jgi:hypothetical protein